MMIGRRGAGLVAIATLIAGVGTGGPVGATGATAAGTTVTVTGTVDVPLTSVTVLTAPTAAIVPMQDLAVASRFSAGDNGDATGLTFSVQVTVGSPVYLKLSTERRGYVPELFVGADASADSAYPRVDAATYTADTTLPTIQLLRTGNARVSTDLATDGVEILRRNGSFVDSPAHSGGGTISGLAPGLYTASAVRKNGTSRVSAPIVVQPGKTTSVKLTFPAAGVLAGRVTSVKGVGLKNVEIGAFGGLGYVTTTTNSTGGYRLSGLKPGFYELSFVGSPGTAAAMYLPRSAVVARVSAGQTRKLKALKLELGGIVKVRGKVGGDGGSAWLQNAGGASTSAYVWGSESVELPTVKPGRYSVVVQRSDNGKYVKKAVTVRAGKTISAGTLTPTTKSSTLVVTVKGAVDGNVWLSGRDSLGILDLPTYNGELTAKGRFTIKRVVPGVWRLGIYAETAHSFWMTLHPLRASVHATRTTVAAKSLTRLATRHTGTVTMAGRPVSGVALSAGVESVLVVVRITAQAADSELPSDANGRFSFRWYPSTESDRLSVSDGGILPERAPFFFRPTPVKVSSPSDLRAVTLKVAGGLDQTGT